MDDAVSRYLITLELVAPREGSPDPATTCSYIPNDHLVASSLDVWGGSYNEAAYFPASPVYPSTVDTVGCSDFGTPNDGSQWGLNSGVPAAADVHRPLGLGHGHARCHVPGEARYRVR